uniref:Putative secreted protein n=1 Tax=Amblyomma americanum TaxID=6943 RepID=A0A0C9RWH8_AMBAM
MHSPRGVPVFLLLSVYSSLLVVQQAWFPYCSRHCSARHGERQVLKGRCCTELFFYLNRISGCNTDLFFLSKSKRQCNFRYAAQKRSPFERRNLNARIMRLRLVHIMNSLPHRRACRLKC